MAKEDPMAKKKTSRKQATRPSRSTKKESSGKKSAKKKPAEKKPSRKKASRKKEKKKKAPEVVRDSLEIVCSERYRMPSLPSQSLMEEGNQHLAFGGGSVEDESLFPSGKLATLMTRDLSCHRKGLYFSRDADKPSDFNRLRGALSALELPESGSFDIDQTQVKVTTKLPWRSICDLMITNGHDQQKVATGFFIGRRTVVTAGHAVVLPPGSEQNTGTTPLWARKVTVSPAMTCSDSGEVLQPFGAMTSTKFFSVKAWFQEGRSEFDIGCILLPDATLGDQVSWFGFAAMSDSELTDLIVNIAGYPVARPAGSMWYDAGRIGRVESLRLKYDLETGPGTSGGPTFKSSVDQRVVVGIHNYGDEQRGISTRITPDIFEVLRLWKAMGQKD